LPLAQTSGQLLFHLISRLYERTSVMMIMMITVDMAFRVNSYSDYGVANALGFISYLIAGLVAWTYVRHNIRQPSGGMTLALGWLWRGSVLGLLAFAVFGPLANLLLWAFAVQW
jgi:hypothetical protein